jgi:tRNA pseudouridine32 synthase/23S rRNA pseudouridine746 synthase
VANTNPDSYLPPAAAPLDIVYLDEYLLVLNKPSGLLSVPGRGAARQDSLALRVQNDIPDALIVHRLDMETSGLIVMARDRSTHRTLSRAFEARRVEKAYEAIASGKPSDLTGTIDLPLICDWPNRPKQMVDFDAGKPSTTRYRVLGHDPRSDTSRLSLTPVTGRTHQLRVHLKAIGHPILGDSLYADPETQQQADRLLLHATELVFCHPTTQNRLVFSSPPPF